MGVRFTILAGAGRFSVDRPLRTHHQAAVGMLRNIDRVRVWA